MRYKSVQPQDGSPVHLMTL